MRIFLARLTDRTWFLLLLSVLFIIAFGCSGYYLSKILSTTLIIALLAGIGFTATHLVFGDIESHIGVVLLIILASVLSEINTTLGAVVMAVPIGIIVSLFFMDWLAKPVRDVLQNEAKEQKTNI